jgi:hypothetical protein
VSADTYKPVYPPPPEESPSSVLTTGQEPGCQPTVSAAKAVSGPGSASSTATTAAHRWKPVQAHPIRCAVIYERHAVPQQLLQALVCPLCLPTSPLQQLRLRNAPTPLRHHKKPAGHRSTA